MSDEVRIRVVAAAGRARAAMSAGANVSDVLRTFRDADQLSALECMWALREIAPMDLSCSKMIVSTWCEGRSYEHLSLADLDLLGDTPRAGGVDSFTRRQRDDAIIDRKPWLLYARRSKQWVYVIASAVPLAAFPSPLAEGQYGSVSGASVSFEGVTADARKAAAAWPSEIAIERDDPDELLLRFLRAPLPSA